MNLSTTSQSQNEKAVRLVDYLLRLASLRSKLVRDIADYERVLWLDDVPRQEGCFTQAWGRDEDYDPEVWAEVQSRREPELPGVPDQCKDWIDKSSLRAKGDFPGLAPEIVRQVRNPEWRGDSDQPEYISVTECLDSFPEVQRDWNRYLEDRWLPWVGQHSAWESVQGVYSALFAIHQEQLRLGEEYELVLGLGLLTWQTPTGQRVRRHLIVADAILEFEARLGRFTVRPHTEGARLRPELDMLDIADQPARAEEAAKSSLANAGDDPWERGCVDGVLEALVHSINPQGEYEGSLESKRLGASSQPIVEFAPALILRKRSAKGLTETLRRIRERIEEGEDIPGEFADLAEMRPRGDISSDDDLGETNRAFDGEVFFPKPSNEEQRRIVDKIRAASGVLVQGPPGTGKSHTIANLICHLLATGQRTLITAKTPRALQVLEGLIPDELRPLCINLLGSGLEEKRSLESSVGGILRRNEEWDEKRSTREREELEQELCNLREEKAEVIRRLRDIRESETHSQSIADGTYRGTAARVAEAVNRDRSAYEWFTDAAPLDITCPISEGYLRTALAALRHLTPQRRRELSHQWPEALLSPERFPNLVENEKRAIEEEARSAKGADERLADLLSKSNVAIIGKIRDALSTFHDTRRRLSASPHAWTRDALRDVMDGNPSLWRELLRATRTIIASIETLVPVADETSLDFPDSGNIRALLEDVCRLKGHMENGGRLGWGPFRPKLVKGCVYVTKTVRVNGRLCSALDDFSVLSDVLRVRLECERAWGFWAGRSERIQGPYALQLQALKALCDALSGVLSVECLIGQCRETLKHCSSLSEPLWADESRIEQVIRSCTLTLASSARCLAEEEIRSIESPLAALIAKSTAHPIVAESLEAIRSRDIEGFARSWNEIQELEKDRQLTQEVDEYTSVLRIPVPRLMDELERTCGDPCWNERIGQIQNAWHWAQARYWVEKYIRQEDAPALARRAKQIEEEINTTIARLASLHAWSFCFSRLTELHRRHMESWSKSVRSLSKTGRGKRDFRLRQAAQRSLNECKDAVPAWVMPLHRVWDTIDPAPGMFDVVIVDEASQCGYEALPLLYLAKKILIVGDDKQISPSGEFQDTTPINKLLDEYLNDFQFKEYFDVNVSLFDHGKLRYGTRRIILREHFRCMPEIIRFSNDLCYSDTPLIPLRQYGTDRLMPLEHIFVRGGYREGSNNRTINRPEAEAIVEKIAELCRDTRYTDKKMGVIVLQGDAQAGLIEGLLLERLGAEEMQRRRLVCGNPYSFQGDERDIVFLSMVAANNQRIGVFTKAADERRFNVAASRARDQMVLFHSVDCDDLSTSCLRRRLLEFFSNTKPPKIVGLDRDELERRAFQDNRSIVKPPPPFDSWFEVDVALELLRRGFIVSPQFEVAGKWIDLVVEGGRARLAVECDGDKWHGVDRYEEDMQRQRRLERCGWEFYQIRESAFYADRKTALQGLWSMLEERGILPGAYFGDPRTENTEVGQDTEDGQGLEEFDSDGSEEDNEDRLYREESPEDAEDAPESPGRRADDVTAAEIQNAIIHVLSECPNRSCTVHSLASRVLVGVQ